MGSKISQTIHKFKFKKVVVSKDFEIENGVLGLERDVYLSIVRFLDSSILRKVCVNIFLF
jgi:hypothetical protein